MLPLSAPGSSWPGLPLIAAALLLLGCEQGAGPAAAPTSEAQRQPPRPVRLVPAVEQVTERRVSATGTLAADEQVVLGTKVAGRIGELLVDLGSRVRRDQTVARLDPTDAQLRVDQAVAALQQARARLGLSPEERTTAWTPSRLPSCGRLGRCWTRRGSPAIGQSGSGSRS